VAKYCQEPLIAHKPTILAIRALQGFRSNQRMGRDLTTVPEEDAVVFETRRPTNT
jgi:hypothetical protein